MMHIRGRLFRTVLCPILALVSFVAAVSLAAEAGEQKELRLYKWNGRGGAYSLSSESTVQSQDSGTESEAEFETSTSDSGTKAAASTQDSGSSAIEDWESGAESMSDGAGRGDEDKEVPESREVESDAGHSCPTSYVRVEEFVDIHEFTITRHDFKVEEDTVAHSDHCTGWYTPGSPGPHKAGKRIFVVLMIASCKEALAQKVGLNIEGKEINVAVGVPNVLRIVKFSDSSLLETTVVLATASYERGTSRRTHFTIGGDAFDLAFREPGMYGFAYPAGTSLRGKWKMVHGPLDMSFWGRWNERMVLTIEGDKLDTLHYRDGVDEPKSSSGGPDTNALGPASGGSGLLERVQNFVFIGLVAPAFVLAILFIAYSLLEMWFD